MSTEAASGRGRLPALTGDARVDRWREHRAAVRAELIEATLRAIEEYGPDLSIDDVVKTAGVPRPKLYRFFDDKDTLFAAVAERVQELIIERVVPRFDVAGTAQQMVRSALTAYVDLVDERPNVFRFLVGSHFRDERSAADLIDGGRPLSDATVAVWAGVIRARGGDDADLEYAVDAALGAVALGVLRWLNTPTIGKDALVEQLTTFLWGALSATAAGRGVVVDPDETLLPADQAD
ncbi:TetR/AcrR family transcriptional regulator [Mycobacterium talmoniae]|uniref:TetR family transcriptional regulator n=1 Tax=Mycobacterium talmoniae TaxID=1858794 RepID=A0A1S1N9Z0_9MYCO|nr:MULTISPECIES: TetR/AcrR family transcriptional regulator [Mycobacterium]OHU98585.1 TetR family transcriptional regulator [Mycobacterium talmoniae]TDH50307.1 TetR/AcrR family transcriptional regulator [Mycobacterium eburneum]